ncbi:MAG: hypothetical protein WBR26_27705 [Candidatus Acidiferrum sp.]
MRVSSQWLLVSSALLLAGLPALANEENSAAPVGDMVFDFPFSLEQKKQ